MILIMWVKEVVLTVTSLSLTSSEFVAKVIESARTRYMYQKANPRERMPPVRQPPEKFRMYNSKLCVLLLPAIHEEVKIRVWEDVDEGTQLTTTSILDEVWNYVAPGGQEEIESLTRYIRKPGSAATATEAIEKDQVLDIR